MTANTSQYLSMPGVGEQRHLRGAINASYAQVASTGLTDAALTVFEKVAEAWQSRAQDTAYVADLDLLHPAALTQNARDRLGAIPEFVDPGQDPADLRTAMANVVGVRGRGVTRIAREAKAACDRAVQEVFDKARLSLAAAAAGSPHRARAIATEAKKLLQATAFPPTDAEPLAKTQRCLKAVEQVNARSSALPLSTREFVVRRLVAEAQDALAEAIKSLAAELADEEFRRQLPRLLAFLDELAGRAAEFAKKLGAISLGLESRRKQAALDQHVSRASVVLPLPGSDAPEVLTGLITRAGAGDLNGLGDRLLERFEAVLREKGARLCPHLDAGAAPLSELIRGTDPEMVADIFARLVEDSAGPGHTLYEALDRFGVEKAAEFLFRRAEQTVSLSDRDVEQFHVAPVVLVIVRLPPSAGPRDPEIRDRLKAKLAHLGPCTFTDGAEADRVVTVVRARVGWPIGIEASNRSLMERYLKSAGHGHRPHLLGFVPDSLLGHVSPAVVEMAQADGASVSQPFIQPRT